MASSSIKEIEPAGEPFGGTAPVPSFATPAPAVRQGIGSGLDADTIHGIQAVTAAVAGPNKLVATGSDGFLPMGIIPSGSPIGTAGGDLAGTYPNPTVKSVANVTTGTLHIANGGTNSSTALSGSSIVVSNGSSIVQGAPGTTTTVLHGNAAGAPTYGAVSMTADVSGTLPIGNGGTGNTTGRPSGVAAGDLSGTYPSPTVAKVNGVTVNNPIGPGTGGAVGSFDNGTGSRAIAFDGTNMWTANGGAAVPITKWRSDGTFVDYSPATVGNIYAIAFDGTNMWGPSSTTGKIYKIAPAGTATGYTVTNAGNSIAFDGTNMWTVNQSTGWAAKISPTGTELLTTRLTTSGNPEGIAFDGTNMWSPDNILAKLYKISPSGTVTTIALTAGNVGQGIAFDGTNLWVPDPNNARVYVYDTTGSLLHTYPVGSTPVGIAWDGRAMWIGENGSTTFYRVATDGTVSTYTGTGQWGPGYPSMAHDGVNMWAARFTSNTGVFEFVASPARTAPSAGMVIVADSGTSATWTSSAPIAVGISGGAVGDVLYQSAASTTGFTAAGAATTVLHGNLSGAPTFSAVSLTADVTGTLPVSNGGTGLATVTAHSVLVGNGTSAIARIAPGTSGIALVSQGASSDPAFAATSLTAGVSGTLPVANGGTGAATLTAHGVLVGEGTSAVTPITLSAGQILVGTTSSDPSAVTLTQTANQTSITSASGSITIGTVQDIGTSSSPTFSTVTANLTGTSTKTNALNSATTVVNVSSAAAPEPGQILTATSPSTAVWANPIAGVTGSGITQLTGDVTATSTAATFGTSVSASSPATTNIIGTLIINVQGDGAQTITLAADASGAAIAADIQNKVQNLTAATTANQDAYLFFTAAYGTKYTLTSGLSGSSSSVVISGGTLAASLKLGVANGGVETAGANAITVVAATVNKVDGVSYPASPGTNTVPVVTSSNTITYETVPVAAGGTGQTSYTDGQILIGNTTGNTLAKATLTGTSNQVVVTNGGGSITLSTPQNIDSTATPAFASETLTATSNQLVLGTTRTVTLTAPTPATSSRTVTLPDLSAAYSIVGTEGTQTINGNKTLSGTTNLSGLSASLPLQTDSSKNIVTSAISLSGSGVTGTLPVANGGTGDASLTAYAVLCGGTTSTGAVQSVSGTGTSAQVLTSNGASALPTWQDAGSGTSTDTLARLMASMSLSAVGGAF